MKKVKIAMVGAGNIANVHLDSYTRVPEAEIYAICDRNEDVLQKTADKYQIERRYTDLDTMLRELPELDAADVCVWNCNHAECSIKALNAGLHVLCEKPMACSTEEAEKMLQAAEENQKLLMIGFVCRFEKNTRIAEDFLRSGYFGDIYYTKALFLRRHGNPGGWFAEKEKSGGGPIIDLGVHMIDLLRYLMGNPKPVSVYAVTYANIGERPELKTGVSWTSADGKKEVCSVEDFGSVMIKYDNGAVTQLETSYSMNAPDEYKQFIYGTKAGMDLNELKLYSVQNGFLADIDLQTEFYKEMQGSEFDAEMAHFVDCILNGTPCRAKAEDGKEIMRILDAIYESAETGHEVIL